MRPAGRGWENASALPPAAVPPASKPVLVLALALAAAGIAHAQKKTVCTITVNSAEEREAFRRNLPPDRFDFVELVEHGRPDWLHAACERHVRCDVLVVSGHFAGTEFYSDRPDVDETLGVDEMERVSCGGSCPDLFSHLKEVYLFGCDSLKSEPVRSAMPEIVNTLVHEGGSRADAERFAKALSERNGEDALDRMRRVFPRVPVIYGFASLAPYGRVSGPLLQRWFDLGGAIGTGAPSESLLRLFRPTSMVATRGMADDDPGAGSRKQVCRFYDDRLDAARKLAVVSEALHADMPELRMGFDRVEKFFATLGPSDRASPAFVTAMAALTADRAAREHYLAITRATTEPMLRLRMIALAATIGWLSPAERHAELGRLIGDLFAAPAIGAGDVDLVCTLNADGTLADALAVVPPQRIVKDPAARAAALACLGSAPARVRVLRALASADEDDVRAAQAYLRHQPITDARELREVAAHVAAIPNVAAQVRALDTLARLDIDDRATLEALAELFARTRSLAVQRALAEVFLRADRHALSPAALAVLLRTHRRPSPDGADLIDTLVHQLERG